MAILPKALYTFNEISIKIPISFFMKIKKSILSFIWKDKKSLIAKALQSKKNSSGRITIPDFKLYYRTIVTKTA
jgi:hypothetical protein